MAILAHLAVGVLAGIALSALLAFVLQRLFARLERAGAVVIAAIATPMIIFVVAFKVAEANYTATPGTEGQLVGAALIIVSGIQMTASSIGAVATAVWSLRRKRT